MANTIVSTETGAPAYRFNAGNPIGDIAKMLVDMHRDGRLSAAEHETLRKHAANEMYSLPMKIRGVAVALMDAITEGNFERSHIANAVWSIDMMADALQGMQTLVADLRAPTGTTNHV